MDLRNRLMIGVAIFVMAGCNSTPPKAEIAGTAVPQEEVTKLDTDIQNAISSHADVLAPKDLKAAQGWLKEAKEDLADNQKQEEIIDDVRKGRGFLSRALGITADRTPQVQGILTARSSALAAGARNFPELSDRLKSYDDDLRDEADSLGKLKTDDYGKMQSNYMDLELAAIQETQLGKAKSIIENAKDNKAEKRAPHTFGKAQTDLKNAENMIEANRKNPEGYNQAVTQANASAQFLDGVMNALREHKKMEESAAVEIVRKNMQISTLQTDLSTAGQQAQSLNQTIQARDQQLQQTNQQLQQASQAVSMQQALETARQEFNNSEAEVFQQGNKLVVRLKAMNFPSGRSELPQSALPLLAKVKDVAKSLNPSEVVIEGHTDSTGQAQKNMSLSEKRAQSVATYLRENGLEEGKMESVGYGFQKPIATNKSAEGRAQNRRVDIIITPADAAGKTRPEADKTSL